MSEFCIIDTSLSLPVLLLGQCNLIITGVYVITKGQKGDSLALDLEL